MKIKFYGKINFWCQKISRSNKLLSQIDFEVKQFFKLYHETKKCTGSTFWR